MARVYGETVGGSVENGEQYLQSVIDAVRWVQINRREDGAPGQQGRGDVDDDERQRRREPEPARRRDRGPKAPADPDPISIIDLTSELRARYSFDPVRMEVIGPVANDSINVAGVRLTIIRRNVAQSPMTEERYALVMVDFTLDGLPEGTMFELDGALVVASEGATYSTSFGVRGDLPPEQKPSE